MAKEKGLMLGVAKNKNAWSRVARSSGETSASTSFLNHQKLGSAGGACPENRIQHRVKAMKKIRATP